MHIRKSATLAINERVMALEAQGKTVYKFGFGQSPFPVPDFLVNSLRLHAHQKSYLPVQGLGELRESIATFYSEEMGREIEASDVLIGPGSKELIWSLISMFQGDIILPAPNWVSYYPQSVMAGKKVHWLQTKSSDNWVIDVDQLDSICQSSVAPKLMVLNYPNNPSGTVPSKKQMHNIADVCRKNHVVLVHDQIYGRLQWEGRFTSFAQIYPEGTIVSDGLSKWAGAGGWRLGFHIFPSELSTLKEQVIGMASETFSCVSSPIQYAAVKAFTQKDEMNAYVQACNYILKTISSKICDMLRPTVEVRPGQGGFYVFPDFEKHRANLSARGITTNGALCEQLLSDTGVALLPGSAFGMDPSALVARLAFVDFDGHAAMASALRQEALSDTENHINGYGDKMLQGVEILMNWLHSND